MSDKEEEKDVLISEQEVWDTLAFANSYMGGLYGNGMSSYLNPDLVAARMKDINLNPLAATQDMLNSAMKDPKNHESELREFSQSFELTSMVYKRLISYLANMLSFDITYTSNAKPEDYKTPKYKKDLDALEKFLDGFDYRKEFKVVIREMLRNDSYFGCMRDVGDGCHILQELPAEYCKITGRWKGGYLFSFNMYWFLQPGVDINMYPDFFKKKFKEIWESSNTIRKYNPSLPPEFRNKSSWIYWVDVPVDVGVCFKLSSELPTNLPYFSPLFNDLVLQPTMRNLQKNMNMAAASKMLVGEVPLLNRDTKATVRDSIAISPELLGKFLALIKSAMSDAIKVASAPLVNMRGVSFEADNEMYDSYLRTALASSGINTNLIFSSNVKPNSIETQLSLNVDEQMMDSLYSQFNFFMNYYGNKVTRTFKFSFVFEGTDFFLNRQERLSDALDLFDKGIILPQKIAAALKMKPHELRKHMEESTAVDFVSLLKVPAFEQQKELADMQIKASEKTSQMSIEAGERNAKLAQETAIKTKTLGSTESEDKGRPKKKTSELGDEGLATRDSASNVGRGGKV